MPQTTIQFSFPVQTSASVGDIAYYVNTSELGGFDINSSNVTEIGEITAIDRGANTITCESVLPVLPDGQVFILFSKNNCQELASMLGYYSLFKFKNTTTDRAELFAITVDAFESSK